MTTLATLVRGARAGATATYAMSGLMLGAQRLGLIGRLPPEVVMDEATGDELEGGGLDAAAVAGHLAFGAGAGAAYAVLTSDRSPLPPGVVTGVAYALGVYAASYAGWIPAVRLLPPPSEDDPRRQGTMVAAHVIYGAALGRRLRRKQP